MNSAILEHLASAIGERAVLKADDIPSRYYTDWSGASECCPLAVIRPKNTEDVAAVLRICDAAKQPVVIQGGLTGLSGGSAPNEDEIALSLERLNKIENIDRAGSTMTLGAGVVLEVAQQAARDAGMFLPIDLGARGSCQIGGNISTNAGGTQVLRYGMMRDVVLGLEAVLPDGRVISAMNRMLKNNSGYDLKQLFIGTEGTLGVVTRAVLRLFPIPKSSCTALCALSSFDQAIALLEHCSASLVGTLSAYELMWSSYYDSVTQTLEGCTSPFDRGYPIYALVEANGADPDNDSERFIEILGKAHDTGYLENAVIAQSKKEEEDFWRIRDGIGELAPKLLNLANVDISIPVSEMPQFLVAFEEELKKNLPQSRFLTFGHIADSNLHIAISSANKNDRHEAYSILYRLTGAYNGAISAEHGIGVAKRDYLHYSRTPEEIQTMKQLKEFFDPNEILNPGRVLSTG